MVNLNTGSFTNGQIAYLYVVNADGTVNANGYPLTIGDGAPAIDTTPPANPTGIYINVIP